MSNEFESIMKKITNETSSIPSGNIPVAIVQNKQRNRMNRICYLVDDDALLHPTTVHITQFLDIPDNLFIEHAYRLILRRPSDPSGKKFFENLLFSGQFTRIEIMGALRYSSEGKRIHTQIPGLLWLYIAIKLRKKIKLIGYILQMPFLFLALPVLLKYPHCKSLWRTTK